MNVLTHREGGREREGEGERGSDEDRGRHLRGMRGWRKADGLHGAETYSQGYNGEIKSPGPKMIMLRTRSIFALLL